jgi:iron complex transport system ATP-binding protein
MTVREAHNILLLDSLEIGYSSGRKSDPLLPPVSASSAGGELIAVIGRNGIGKSTLLRTLAGLQPPLGGDVLISGKSIRHYSRLELAKKTGYISTEVVRVSNMSVYDLVSLGRFPHTNWMGTAGHEDRMSVENSIARTGLDNLRNRNISEISDGERQKAMIARVLAQDTDFMIMDEPTAFLDIAGKYGIVSLLMKLAADGKTIIFSTHDFSIALNHADKIWLLLNDRLVEGAPEDLMSGGAFEHLFESPVVKFNSGDGAFSFMTEKRGMIFLEGEGLSRKFTEKALLRSGFDLSDSKTDPYIKISGQPEENWLLVSGMKTEGFRSLYDLARRLRN